ncbi:signal peptidase I [Bacillus tianshenii]|uniref:Signal peptidase I n=1 Tax=Sutcliffiella tianshenii TaxID=1463404 RepID=A0ABS2P0T2_9BACI|nr:signal peptidase I [Bacillus tianshenii]MBM7620252.1 signal peptidase I [Bacillus tianshenii]
MENDSTKTEVFSWIKSLLAVVVLVIVCRQFLFTPVTVNGGSMSPTFQDNDRVMVLKMSEIEHFDMIVFEAPTSSDKHIKRVIGMAGDTLKVMNDRLYINDALVEEPYLEENKASSPFALTEDFEVVVPEDCLFVMGDNRLSSGDSRLYGFVPKDNVFGEVKIRFYPLSGIGLPE